MSMIINELTEQNCLLYIVELYKGGDESGKRRFHETISSIKTE